MPCTVPGKDDRIGTKQQGSFLLLKDLSNLENNEKKIQCLNLLYFKSEVVLPMSTIVINLVKQFYPLVLINSWKYVCNFN